MKNAEILMESGVECVCGALIKEGVELGRVTDTGAVLNEAGKAALAEAIAGSQAKPKRAKTQAAARAGDADDAVHPDTDLPVAGIDMTKLAD